MQLVKSKNKQSEVSVVSKSDFLRVTGLKASTIEPLEAVVYLNSKFSEIYQVKNVFSLLSEVQMRSSEAKQMAGHERTFKQLDSEYSD